MTAFDGKHASKGGNMVEAGKRLTIAAVALTALAVSACGGSDGTEETLTFTETDKDSTFKPIGDTDFRKGLEPGNGFVLSIPLHESAADEAVGEINAVCIATQPSEQDLIGTCSGTAEVPDGQLAINIGGEIGDDVDGAVTGGTGKYVGATGNFISKSSGEGSEDTFSITLP